MGNKKRESERNKQLLQYYRVMVAVILILFISLLCVSILALNLQKIKMLCFEKCKIPFFRIYKKLPHD